MTGRGIGRIKTERVLLESNCWSVTLETAVGSRKSTQALDAPGKAGKYLITNKVTMNFPASPCTPISYIPFSRPTAVSRVTGTSLYPFS